ncbi:MAG: ABC transporter ATP-binding protein [Bellilinea sp.]
MSNSTRPENSKEQPPAPGAGRAGMPARGAMGGRGPFGGGHMMMGKVEKARDFKGTLKRLIVYLNPFKVTISIVLVLALGSTVFAILGPKMLGAATTKLFEGLLAQLGGTGSIDFPGIGQILLSVLGLYLFSSALSYLQGWMMTDVSITVTYQLRKEIMQKINRTPFGYFDNTTHGEVLSRLTNDVDTVSQTLSQSLTQIITSIATVVGVLVMMLTISWQMTLLALLIVPLSLVVVLYIVKNSQRFFTQQQEFLGKVNGHVEEMFGGHTIVKAFNGEKKSIERFDQYNTALYGSAWQAQFFSGIMMPVMSFISNLGYVGVTILGGWLAIRGLITLGDIQAFIQYVRSFTQPLTQLANSSNVLQQTVAAAERVFEFLSVEEEVAEISQPARLAQVRGEVEFRNVRFGYLPEKPVIHDFSAHIQPGQKVAIVGPTGAGKTTMVKLLMRFYDAQQGEILIDGVNIKNFSREDLRRMFGMVLQDTWLFNGTLADNIRYGREDASEEDIIRAARAAHVDHFIRTLPEGYNMVLNEEVTNISQGQKQLLTIARAILADPAMLILDEATSSVDTHTEMLIQRAMSTLMQGRTSFIIAHRLSTIRNADLILVMRDGNIVEQGRHDELLERGGFYAELYNSQFEKIEAEPALVG